MASRRIKRGRTFRSVIRRSLSIFQIQQVGQRSEGFLASLEPSVGDADRQRIPVDECRWKPEQRELVSHRVFVDCVFHMQEARPHCGIGLKMSITSDAP